MSLLATLWAFRAPVELQTHALPKHRGCVPWQTVDMRLCSDGTVWHVEPKKWAFVDDFSRPQKRSPMPQVPIR